MSPYVMIATPCKDGTVDVNYSFSLNASCQVLSSAGIQFRTSYACTSSIDNGRSVLATLFLKSECDYLLFIDDDMGWASDLPLRLLNENVDIVGVPYRKKKGQPEFTVKHSDSVASMGERPWMVMVDALGMGMTLIHRRVLEAMKNDVPEYHCYTSEINDPQRLFFRHELVKDPKDNMMKYESEDFHFCRMAREKGFDIWAYVDEPITHIGRRAFSGRYSDHIGVGTSHGFTSERERYTMHLVGIES